MGQIQKMFEKNKRQEKHENTTKKIGQSVFSGNSGKPPQHLRLKPAGTHQQWAFCSICTHYVYVQFIRTNMQILCNGIETQYCNMSTKLSLDLPSLHHLSNYCVGSPVGLDCESSHANEEQLGSPSHLEGNTGGCR